MWLAFLVLFIALCPGVLFTAPAIGGLRGKMAIAAIHAVVFVVAVNLFYVVEGFASSAAGAPGTSAAKTNLTKAYAAYYAAVSKDYDNIMNQRQLQGKTTTAVSDSIANSTKLNTLLQSTADSLDKPVPVGGGYNNLYDAESAGKATKLIENIVIQQAKIADTTKNFRKLNDSLKSVQTKIATDKATVESSLVKVNNAITAAQNAGYMGEPLATLTTSGLPVCGSGKWLRGAGIGTNYVYYCEPCSTKHIPNGGATTTPQAIDSFNSANNAVCPESQRTV